MRYDPRRAQSEENELIRSRDEMLRLQAENARLASIAQHIKTPINTPVNTPVNTPAFGRMHAARMPVPRAARAPQSSQPRILLTIALVIIAFLAGFWYANALSDGAALRQLQASDGMLPSP